jgi:glutathione S-transferase
VDGARAESGARVMRLQTTAACRRTPEVVMALEELQLPYELERVPDGHFMETHGRIGPRLVDGELVVFEPGAMLKHLARRAKAPLTDAEWCEVDQWLELSLAHLRPAAARVGRLRMSGRGDDPLVAQETDAVLKLLALLDRHLRGREWMLGRFSVLDCSLTALGMLQVIGFELERFEALATYRARLMQRPSWVRAMEKLAA